MSRFLNALDLPESRIPNAKGARAPNTAENPKPRVPSTQSPLMPRAPNV